MVFQGVGYSVFVSSPCNESSSLLAEPLCWEVSCRMLCDFRPGRTEDASDCASMFTMCIVSLSLMIDTFSVDT